MFAVGFLAVAFGLWMLDSAIKNRRPVKTLTAIIQNPSRYRQMIKAGEGTLTDLTYDDEGYLTGNGGSREWGKLGPAFPNGITGTAAYVSGPGNLSKIGPTPTGKRVNKKGNGSIVVGPGEVYLNPDYYNADGSRKGAAGGGSGGGKASGVIAYARAQIGKPYIWGGVGPKGYDCSGLIYMAYKSVGINIPRTTSTMIGSGRKVSKDDIQPGDLIFPYPGHVFLAIGNGRAIEAPRTGQKIKEIGIYGRYYAIRRYL